MASRKPAIAFLQQAPLCGAPFLLPYIPKLLVGARASARFGVWMGKILKFPGRSGVLKLKRRKRRAPLPITSGCTGFITMQNIVIARPYRFVPPRFSRFWARIIQWYL